MTNLPVLNPGPRTLPHLSQDAKAALHPYMALIVGYRRSGLSLNHIIGCPIDCGYCVRHFWGNFDVKVPLPPLSRRDGYLAPAVAGVVVVESC